MHVVDSEPGAGSCPGIQHPYKLSAQYQAWPAGKKLCVYEFLCPESHVFFLGSWNICILHGPFILPLNSVARLSWVLIWLLMPDYNDIFPLSCNSFKALNRHMGSNEINNWITSICSVVLSCMQRSAIFSFLVSIFVLKRSCLCSKTIVDLKTNFLVFRRSKLKDSQNSCKRYIDAFLFYFHTIFSY